MPEGAEPAFTLVNYRVCNYCALRAIGEYRDSVFSFCSAQRTPDGFLRRLQTGRKRPESIQMEYGCDLLVPSGLPMHPAVAERMKSELPQTAERVARIPLDSAATETSWDFFDKAKRYPHADCEFPVFVGWSIRARPKE